MLPQQTVQPKNKAACTAAPSVLRRIGPNPPTHASTATSFMPCSPPLWQRLAMLPYQVTESFVVGGCVGQGRRWTTMSPYQHGICRSAMAQGMQAEALLVFLGLLVKPACQPDASFPALDGCGRKALPGLPCKVSSTNGVSLIPTLEVEGNSVEAIHYPWISISKSQVECVCQTLELLVQGTACHQGGALPHP
jgi:hypothetical protein